MIYIQYFRFCDFGSVRPDPPQLLALMFKVTPQCPGHRHVAVGCICKAFGVSVLGTLRCNLNIGDGECGAINPENADSAQAPCWRSCSALQ